MRKRRMQTIGSNAVDGASSSWYWGKKRCKLYKGVAGKGGKTTNSAVGDTMIHREMKEAGKN